MRLRTNSQYLAQSKQNVHKYNQKYFYYLPNKLCSLSQNEFERIIFNEVILSEIFNKNQSKYLLQAFRKVLKMIYYSVYFEQNWRHNADQLWRRETQSDFLKQKTFWFCFASRIVIVPPNISHIWNYWEKYF